MTRLIAILAVVSSSIVGWALSPAASASPLCEQVWTGGTVLGTHQVGECVPYDKGTLCHFEDAGADPPAHVYTEFCVPAVVMDSPAR